MDVVWYCTVKRVSSMGLALSTSFRLKMLIVTWAFVSCPAPDRPTQSRPIVAMIRFMICLFEKVFFANVRGERSP